MKNIAILPVLILLSLISSCSKDPMDTTTGSGVFTSEIRNVTNFTKISSEGVFEVSIIPGNSQSIELIADDNVIHTIQTNVANDELRLYLDDNYNYTSINLKVNIIVPSINGLKNSGAGNISVLDLNTSDDFNVYNSGSGDISIEGNAKSLILKNEGSGNFEGFQFVINEGHVKNIGSGNCKINCTNNLKVTIDGSGNVYYLDTPIIETNISGSGKIVNSN